MSANTETGSGEMISLAQYILDRLYEAGVHDLFGVPEISSSVFFNFLEKSKIKYIGTCNELEAAYAADGYARMKGIGAVSTTYNVGELSAMNGVAGAWAEMVPVVKLTGCPATPHFKKGTLLHHTLGDYEAALKMFKRITVDAEILLDIEKAPEQVDRILTNCLRHSRPVYIGIPSDLVKRMVPKPKQPFKKPEREHSNPQALKEAVSEVMGMLKAAKAPMMIPGVELHRFNLVEMWQGLLETSGLPYATMMLSKSILSEDHPQFIGLYSGARSREGVRKPVEDSDCVLIFGEMLTDFNTGGFSAALKPDRCVSVMRDSVQVSHHVYHEVYIWDFIQALHEEMVASAYKPSLAEPITPAYLTCVHRATHRKQTMFQVDGSKQLTQHRFFERIANFLKPTDIVLAETGSAMFAVAETMMPHGAKFVAQIFYGSIGYTTGAALGTAIAEKDKRTVLFIGDGSFQVTVQGLSTMIKEGVKPVIFLINNDGYTIERVIVDHPYNDVQPWKYAQLVEAFGGGKGIKVSNEGELEKALEVANTATELTFIEAVFDRWDCNESLKAAGRQMAISNELLEKEGEAEAVQQN